MREHEEFEVETDVADELPIPFWVITPGLGPLVNDKLSQEPCTNATRLLGRAVVAQKRRDLRVTIPQCHSQGSPSPVLHIYICITLPEEP